MPLSEVRIPRRKIVFDGGDVEVRGITLQDVAIIVDSHQYAIDRIITMLRTRADLDFSNPEIIIDTVMEVIRESPLVASNIIAMCADEYEQQDMASKLPLPVQTEILQAIGDLTFVDAAAVKKFVADVVRLIRGILPPTTEAAAA
jgi:hypothetical protein